jgi:hypothetical protein
MQVRADLAPVGFTYLPEREVTFHLRGYGIVDQVDRPNAKLIKNFLRDMLIADIAHAGLAAQEGAVPVKFGFSVDSYDEYGPRGFKARQLPLSRAEKPDFRRARHDLQLLLSFRRETQTFNVLHLASLVSSDS